MKNKSSFIIILVSLFLVYGPLDARGQDQQVKNKVRVSLEKRVPSVIEAGSLKITQEIQDWNAGETAIIVVDMWNQHWCKDATARVAELAPEINKVISLARDKGMLIVHAPSECMDAYKGQPGRKLAQKYKGTKTGNLISDDKLATEKNAVWPIDQSDGGCNDSPECTQGSPWTKQTDLIVINDKDAISDSGVEIAGLFRAKGIKNVILVGVHTNMCVINRSFGLRNMVRLGMNVALMRDMTDTMYDSKQAPNVSHFTGNSLMIEYIEKFICPTMVSSDLTGKKQFRFKDDNRPVVAFIIAENEYHANKSLPEFAHDLLLTKGVQCEYALGKDEYTEPNLHNIENLQIMKDADLAVFFIRRRALPSQQMSLVKEYVNSGKPVLGLRTASHSFNANKVVPNSGGTAVDATGKVPEFLDQWPEFDKDVFGGNYVGHYGTMKEGIVFSLVPGMENHPLFKGVSPENFIGPVAPLHTLYENRPLRSANIQVLMLGAIPEKPVEPVLWINHREKGKVVYTSMGHWDDWKIEKFRTIMFNTVDYLLNTQN